MIEKRKVRKSIQSSEIMPFGRYSSMLLSEIPASYLLWVAKQKWGKKCIDVYAYVLRHETELKRRASEEMDAHV